MDEEYDVIVLGTGLKVGTWKEYLTQMCLGIFCRKSTKQTMGRHFMTIRLGQSPLYETATFSCSGNYVCNFSCL